MKPRYRFVERLKGVRDIYIFEMTTNPSPVDVVQPYPRELCYVDLFWRTT